MDLRSQETEFVGSQSIGVYTPTVSRKNAPVENNNLTDSKDALGAYLSSGRLHDDSNYVQEAERGVYDRVSRLCRKMGLILFLDPKFYAYTFSWVGFSVGYYSAFTYIIPYGKTELGLSDIHASMLVTSFSGGEVFSRVMYGLFFDKMPKRFRIIHVSTLFAVFSLGTLVFPFIRGNIAVMIFCAFLGATGGGMDGIFSAFIAEIFSVQSYPLVYGYSNIFTHSIGMASTVLIGTAVDHLGSLKVPFYIGSCTAFLAVLTSISLSRLVRRKRKLMEEIQRINTENI